MEESIKLVKLDLMIVKKYWKEMVMTGLILAVSIGLSMPLLLNMILFLVSNTLLSYPFIIQEKDNMDKFYSIIAVTKLDIVRSKYLSALLYMLVISVCLIPINVFVQGSIKGGNSMLTILLLLSMGVLLYSVVAAIQIPCYFKWGYTKSKIITIVLPMAIGVGIPIMVVGVAKLMGESVLINIVEYMIGVFSTHCSTIILGCLILAVVCLISSYFVSKSVYVTHQH